MLCLGGISTGVAWPGCVLVKRVCALLLVGAACVCWRLIHWFTASDTHYTLSSSLLSLGPAPAGCLPPTGDTALKAVMGALCSELQFLILLQKGLLVHT